MGSTTLTLPPATVLITPLVAAACSGICTPVNQHVEAHVPPVHVEWVVITDKNGNRRLQMHWLAK